MELGSLDSLASWIISVWRVFKMKRTIIATALLAATGVANAGLSFDVLSTMNRTEDFNPNGGGFTTLAVGTPVSIGTLKVDSAMDISYTYLGSESGYDNVFYNLYVGGSKLFEDSDSALHLPDGFTNPIGTYVNAQITSAGALDFAFEGAQGRFAYNDRVLHAGWNAGGTTPGWSESTSIGLIGTNMVVNGQTYAYVIGFNDSAGNNTTLGDWDDFVIGVNPVPEPETYAMLLAGLGLMGFVARRRKQSAAA